MSDNTRYLYGRHVYCIGGRPNSPGFLDEDGGKSFVLPSGNCVAWSRGQYWEAIGKSTDGYTIWATYPADDFLAYATEVRKSS